MKSEDQLLDLINRLSNALMEVSAHVIIDKESALSVSEALLLIDEANKVILDHGKTH